MKKRRNWIVAIVLASLIGLTLLAPRNALQQQGSTYNRAPNGYGAWYAYLEEQGIPVRRWQRPVEELGLATEDPTDATAPVTRSITFVQINPVPRSPSPIEQEWARVGHTVVLVGIQTPVTAAPFSSVLDSPQGKVRIETRRRYPEAGGADKSRLGDDEGSVVWEQAVGKGQVIYINTPYFAANAYQDEAGNIPFLAALVAEPGHPVWVDEYLHGYRDPDILAEEKRGNAFAYLVRTPVLLVAIQALVLLLLAVWGDRRLGPPLRVEPAKTDSNATYIGALGSVLNKAKSSEFVMETVGRHEQEQIQRSLGLGVDPVEPDQLLEAWTQQTGQPATELQSLLAPVVQKRRLRERELLLWLENLRQVRRHLP
ncbi:MULTISPECIES: DUF4350 domain-containing protein [unclassified Leptolyngbya]|uniref:DUF4350 domain-containing protein n=1 Tax=unclassified Leptolyngbya TaxID=2650499 RepID=UPI001684ABE4|nr:MULTISPECIES: DUF4350 domain-containing protein [unclassified Leptolyngbya]MBD1914180.1 DUF4350 domain-containing protein [Leptolyngbya sp. FACHB-8]MBD2157187.1 DUF4350 domain-containing protein [Leptolyngbya sp. FACHB-16]